MTWSAQEPLKFSHYTQLDTVKTYQNGSKKTQGTTFLRARIVLWGQRKRENKINPENPRSRNRSPKKSLNLDSRGGYISEELAWKVQASDALPTALTSTDYRKGKAKVHKPDTDQKALQIVSDNQMKQKKKKIKQKKNSNKDWIFCDFSHLGKP